MSVNLRKLERNELIHIHPVQVKQKKVKTKVFPPDEFSNVFISSRKKTGKTTLIYNIVKRLYGRSKNTVVFVFAPTAHRDSIYGELEDYIRHKEEERNDEGDDEEEGDEEKEQEHYFSYSSLDEDCAFDDLMEFMSEPDEEKLNFIIVFDDLGDLSRDKRIGNLVRKNRHFRCDVIISCQAITDITPASIKQMDAVLLLPNQEEKYLKHLYEKINLPIPLHKFFDFYKEATSEAYQFLYIDCYNDKFYKNFEFQLS